MLGCVLQSSLCKYLLVETEDKDGAEAEQMPNKYSAGAGADDYHEDGTNHTHFTNLDLERKKNPEMVREFKKMTDKDCALIKNNIGFRIIRTLG